jgi:serine/threonine-protein kinase RsbW
MRFSQIDLYTADNRMKAVLVLASHAGEVATFMRRLLKMLAACDFPTTDVFAIQLAVEEELTNAIKHGNAMDRSKRVQVAVALGKKECRIRIRDEGEGFDPAKVSDPAAPDGPSGRGLWLMRHYMHEVRYNGKGNVVTLVRRRSGAP